MVVTAPAPAIVVPDEQTWTMAGVDPAGLGVEPVFDPAAARRVLLPDRVPEALAGPLRDLLAALPSRAVPDASRLAFAGDVDPDAADKHAHEGHGEHDHHGGHDDHGGHDHHDMMAIVGEPSADGLVMEPIELRFGPLGTPLPAGIVADVTLDGDVVAACEVSALLVSHDPPDLLAPKAWDRATHGGELAAAEVERALSHTAWLRAFGRVLGWRTLVERAGAALRPVIAAQSLRPPELAAAEAALTDLARFVERSRRLRWRTEGRARVSERDARTLGLPGPAARASGVADDARSDDPHYRRLGFEPVVRLEGDAWARTVVRAAEAAAALRLASAAVADGGPSDVPRGPVVEGPRGGLRATGSLLVAAGATAVGAEWATAVVGIASFDLSPWRVAP
jgi:hypothetical protein